MFDSHEKYTGTHYTMTIASLLVALVFSPAVLLVLRPVEYLSVSLAIVCSALCAGFAWMNWKRHSRIDNSFYRGFAHEVKVIRHRVSQAAVLCAIFAAVPLRAADFSTYRGLQFGEDVAAALKPVGMKLSDVRLVHQRPARIQEVEWRPGFQYGADARSVDPVREVLLRFYNGELFQIITTYDRQRVEGMTEADMVEAISVVYGNATKPGGEVSYHSNYGEVAPVLARWGDAEYSYDLIRTGDQKSFAVILSLKRLDVLAQAAIAEAGRLDAVEAPQRAIDLQEKQEAEHRLELDKARSVNKPNFRP